MTEDDPDRDWGMWEELYAAQAKVEQLEAENADLKSKLDRMIKLFDQYVAIDKANREELTGILNAN